MKKVQFFLTCLPVLCAPAVYAKALPGKNTAIISPVPVRPADPLTTDDNSFLPLLGEVAKTHGYDLPEPFGININYMNMRQNIDVDSIRFSGLGLTGHAFPSDLFDIQASHTRERSITKTVKLDAWLFPFMNIYALVGKTRGSSHSTVSVDSSPANGVISSIIHGMNESGALKNLDFSLRFHGTTYGAGTVLAGGYGNWYGLMDINYTRTDFNILDGHTDAFTLTPRVGYRFTTPGVDILSLPAGKLGVWVGTMYLLPGIFWQGPVTKSPATLMLQQRWDLLNVTVCSSLLNTGSDAEVVSGVVPGSGTTVGMPGMVTTVT